MRSIYIKIISTIVFFYTISCNSSVKNQIIQDDLFIYVLGITQDGGYPQAGCIKKCCVKVNNRPDLQRMVTSIAIVDNLENECWIIDVTPDFPKQLAMINDITNSKKPVSIDGLFLTHAHVGHYAGLIHLGHEVMGANDIPVYSMPRMKNFLNSNGPWSQLLIKKNIQIKPLFDESIIYINDKVSIVPFLVPHRDEFSETVGYKIQGPNNSILFIPDIDKWNLWNKNIISEVYANDYLLLDGTFYDDNELPGRDISAIPHPFVNESIELFKELSISEKNKIHFIHFNHTNPLNLSTSVESNSLIKQGFKLAKQGQIIEL